MKWPKSVKRITYSIKLNEETMDEIMRVDFYDGYLKEKLECVQGTVEAEYVGSGIYITVTSLADSPDYWTKIETAINLHIRENTNNLDDYGPIYTRHGRKYYKLQRHEIIKNGAMQSWCCGELHPIVNAEGKTVGNTPADFSPQRDFYNFLD